MATAFNDTPFVEHDDLIQALDRVDATGHHDNRPARKYIRKFGLNTSLSLRINRRQRVIEDQDLRIEGERSRERRTLSLSAGEHHASFAD